MIEWGWLSSLALLFSSSRMKSTGIKHGIDRFNIVLIGLITISHARKHTCNLHIVVLLSIAIMSRVLLVAVVLFLAVGCAKGQLKFLSVGDWGGQEVQHCALQINHIQGQPACGLLLTPLACPPLPPRHRHHLTTLVCKREWLIKWARPQRSLRRSLFLDLAITFV